MKIAMFLTVSFRTLRIVTMTNEHDEESNVSWSPTSIRNGPRKMVSRSTKRENVAYTARAFRITGVMRFINKVCSIAPEARNYREGMQRGACNARRIGSTGARNVPGRTESKKSEQNGHEAETRETGTRPGTPEVTRRASRLRSVCLPASRSAFRAVSRDKRKRESRSRLV